MPEGVRIDIELNSWNLPPVFSWLQKLGDIESDEMFRVFNMGIGLVLVVSPFFADSVQRMLTDAGFANWRIGQAVPGPRDIVWSKPPNG